MQKYTNKKQFAIRVNRKPYAPSHGQGQIVGSDVPCRKSEADRIAVFSHRVAYYLFGCPSKGDRVVVHVAHGSHHQPVQPGQMTAAFQVHHHAVYMVQVFVQVFDEEDFAIRVDIACRTAQAVQYRQIAAYKQPLGHSVPVQLVAFATVLHRLSPQHAPERLGRGEAGFLCPGRNVDRHCAVQGCHIHASVQVAVENRDVAISHNPLGMFAEGREIQSVDDTHCPISPSGAEDSRYFGVVNQTLQ